MEKSHFTPALFKFLRELESNNNRPWFQSHKDRYETDARNPLLDFIGAAGPGLRKISKHIVADSSPTGGSMFRIYRDTRFSKNKTPYKTHVAARFPLSNDRNVHSPGYYLHLQAGEVFVGGGIWRPEAPALGRIREYLASHPTQWKQALADRKFKKTCVFEGDKLKRPPRGFDPKHELIEYLMHKDFTFYTPFTEKQACSPGFMGDFLASCGAAAPLMRFLCDALGLPW